MACTETSAQEIGCLIVLKTDQLCHTLSFIRPLLLGAMTAPAVAGGREPPKMEEDGIGRAEKKWREKKRMVVATGCQDPSEMKETGSGSEAPCGPSYCGPCRAAW